MLLNQSSDSGYPHCISQFKWNDSNFSPLSQCLLCIFGRHVNKLRKMPSIVFFAKVVEFYQLPYLHLLR